VVDDINHKDLRSVLREEGVSSQVIKAWKQSDDPNFATRKDRVPELCDIADGNAKPKGGPAVLLRMDAFGPLNLQPRPGKHWAPAAVEGEKSATLTTRPSVSW
jgi:hypothetical protein